jgi:hypothetical protein
MHILTSKLCLSLGNLDSKYFKINEHAFHSKKFNWEKMNLKIIYWLVDIIVVCPLTMFKYYFHFLIKVHRQKKKCKNLCKAPNNNSWLIIKTKKKMKIHSSKEMRNTNENPLIKRANIDGSIFFFLASFILLMFFLFLFLFYYCFW